MATPLVKEALSNLGICEKLPSIAPTLTRFQVMVTAYCWPAADIFNAVSSTPAKR